MFGKVALCALHIFNGQPDPSKLHHPIEQSMWTHTKNIIHKHCSDNETALTGTAAGIGVALAKEKMAPLRELKEVTIGRDFLSQFPTQSDRQFTDVIEDTASDLAINHHTQEVLQTSLDSSDRIRDTQWLPRMPKSMALITLCAVGVAGACKLTYETYKTGVDIKNTYTCKQNFEAWKNYATECYNKGERYESFAKYSTK
jgi:hypothetical protein